MTDITLLNIKDFIDDKATIGTKLINQILHTVKFKDIDMTCEQNKTDDLLLLEDVFTYGDLFYSMEEDKRTHKYVLKSGNNRILTCYEPRTDRIQIRTLQQKLADVSTNFVIRNFTDKTYAKLFVSFYKPMARVISTYCRMKNYNIPTDVCLYYKGGNLFRILLTDITNIFSNQDYKDLMKRSDADFQIYINPNLKEYEQVRYDISILVVYVLYSLKDYVKKGTTIRIGNNTDTMKEEYISELLKADLSVKSLQAYMKQDAKRQDFMVSTGKIVPTDKNEYVMIKKYDSIVHGIESRPATYFISRNTSLDFRRRDNRRAVFDLIRFRRNFRLNITMKNGEYHEVNAPFEIIDVSIPKIGDYGLNKMKQNADRYVMEYAFNNKLRFTAPTLEYMLEDLHDLLFKQNEYPWNDIKYDKRITRYFLSIIVYEIVDKIRRGERVENTIKIIHDTFEHFMKFIKCVARNDFDCQLDETNIGKSYINKLYDEWEVLVFKIETLEDNQEKEKERKNLIKFAKSLEGIFQTLLLELKQTIAVFNNSTENELRTMYYRLFTKGITNIL